jgi:EAL domain-containing protein (putative c-di-GMP-specific phosphodiesterase class I)
MARSEREAVTAGPSATSSSTATLTRPRARSGSSPSSGWTARLERVLDEPALVRPAFQPIFDLVRGRVSGFEALARFAIEPRRSPIEWLAAASERGVEHAFEATLLQASLAARAALPENCFLSINVGPAALLSPEGQRVLERAGRLDATVIELTEREPVDDYAALGSALDVIRSRGGMVAVDDAGAGYSSLQHIMWLRPEFIKLDRALVAGLDGDAAKLALVEAVGSFAAHIDAWLVAEGIERSGELDAVRRIDVPLGQGFGLARPAMSMGDAAQTVAHPPLPFGAAREVSPLAGVLTYARPLHRSKLTRAGERFVAEPQTDSLVVVDEEERPIGLLRRSGGPVRSPMCVLVGEAPEALARRAMTRPVNERFDPMVACDERGHYVGLLQTDQLVHLLSRIVNERSKA